MKPKSIHQWVVSWHTRPAPVDFGHFDVTCRPPSLKHTQTPEMAEIGYWATKETLPQIREFLQNLDGDLFRVAAQSKGAT